tara:strand:+ start:789 stop:1184 length:396 start_codon:yes stop_codon:yes gene_type:complete
MNQFVKKIALSVFSILWALFFVFVPFHSDTLAVTDRQQDYLIEKISKDYTKKFCNSIGFGLSQESAMNFANKENNLIFQRKKGIESLNKKLLASKISISVVETCGYPINLKGADGINKFENDYIATNNITE